MPPGVFLGGGEGLGKSASPERAVDLRLSALTVTALMSRGSFGSSGDVGISQSTTFETCYVSNHRQLCLELSPPHLGELLVPV